MSPKRNSRPGPVFRVRRIRVVERKFSVKRRAIEGAYRHRGSKESCAYCGERAECVDHAVPASWAAGAAAMLASHQLVKLASCLDCNSRAGSVVDATFADRRARIHASLLSAKRRALARPKLDNDDLDDVGPELRAKLLRQDREADKVRRRLAVLASAKRPEGVPVKLMVAV